VKIEPFFLLAGPEAGKRSAFIDELRAAIKTVDGAEAEEHRLYAMDTGISDLLSLIRNGSLFSTRRLVEFRGVELVKSKDELAALADYLAQPAPDAVLLLETDAFYAEKALEEAVGKDHKKTFFDLFENEKPRWVEKKLRDRGIGIDEDGVETLLELIENDTEDLEAACSRLSLVFPEGTTLHAADIEASLARNRQEDAFSLFARMVEDDAGWAMETLDTVLADRQGGAVQIVSALTWSFRRLLKLHAFIEGGEGFESACLKLGIRAKSLQALHRKAIERYPRRDCERIIRLASEFDERARISGAVLERSLLQLFIYGCMIRGGLLDLRAASRD
jgi:DNA polymerase-3 subunit delta